MGMSAQQMLQNDPEYLARQLAQQEIPREELSRTFTAWDLGMGDSTSIWVAQLLVQPVC